MKGKRQDGTIKRKRNQRGEVFFFFSFFFLGFIYFSLQLFGVRGKNSGRLCVCVYSRPLVRVSARTGESGVNPDVQLGTSLRHSSSNVHHR